MEKIHRLVGAWGCCFEAYGVTAAVRVNRSEMMEDVKTVPPPGWAKTNTKPVDSIFSILFTAAGIAPGRAAISFIIWKCAVAGGLRKQSRVPTPASTASCFPLLYLCMSSIQCCSGNCGISGVNLVGLP